MCPRFFPLHMMFIIIKKVSLRKERAKIMNWSQFNPLKRVEHYTIFLHHLGLFSEQDKNEILKKIMHFNQRQSDK